MQVRSAADSAKKFRDRASAAQADYKTGVANAGARWQAGAEAAAEAHKAGTMEALNEDRFAKGIRKAGASKYQENAVKLGPERFATGVANAQGAYEKGVQPYLAAMASANLSPRQKRGSNAARITENMELMRRVRREQLGA